MIIGQTDLEGVVAVRLEFFENGIVQLRTGVDDGQFHRCVVEPLGNGPSEAAEQLIEQGADYDTISAAFLLVSDWQTAERVKEYQLFKAADPV